MEKMRQIEKIMDHALEELTKLLDPSVKQSSFFIESRTYVEDTEVWKPETCDLETFENALAHKNKSYYKDDVRIVEVYSPTEK